MGNTTVNIKYGIKVPFEGSKLWTMEDSGNPWPDNLRPQLFDTREAAESAAQIWKTYSIEEYHNNNNVDYEKSETKLKT